MQTPTPSQKRVEISLRTADRDMEMAESAVRHTPHLYENIGFHCQQAEEKYAKAALVASGLPAPCTHVLVRLLQPLVQASLIALDVMEMNAAATLQEFAVEWRYDTDDAPSYASADLLAMAYRFRVKLRPLALAFLN